MAKQTFKAGAMLSPLPVVMVSCGKGEESNIITIAWSGIINSDPPMTYVSVRPERHSHHIIMENKEFVINLCTRELTEACDWCGVKSGAKVDKWKEMKLTKEKAEVVDADMIAESPINLECKVKEVHKYPSHDMFVAEIINVHVAEELVDSNGKICMEKAGLVAYSHGEYVPLLGENIGTFGFSVMKEKTKKRLGKK